jgi:uncharacterized protein (DUF1499 family)
VLSPTARPKRRRFVSGLLLLAALLLPSVSTAQPLPENPLSPCPASPNCERRAVPYDVPADSLFRAARQALDALGPVALRLPGGTAARRAEAVYRVALVFKDDVAVEVAPREGAGSVLFVRSASRVGYSDLGVNRRRVERLLAAVETAVREQR